jgi:hypothetical protein
LEMNFVFMRILSFASREFSPGDSESPPKKRA